MKKEDLINESNFFVERSDYNFIKKEDALSIQVEGMKIFDSPLFAFGCAKDPYFQLFQNSAIVSEKFLLPQEWLDGAKTVISFFLPFTKIINESNKKHKRTPSQEWLHGRVEGQYFVEKLCIFISERIKENGFRSVIPSIDPRFKVTSFSSNWSERHAGFVCGLGTFGLSKGLITAKGMSGRIGSVITDQEFPLDKREYSEVYEYCTMCGACVKRCPANAISKEHGKNHKLCSDYIDEIAKLHKSRYGCGKCQVGVPCQSKIP
ncbi:4Fe-4S binding protein [Anaerosacchariphilus polymeriproducens]|uniref:Epoxyqueuosine reductase n=1 Tax=Anaerosacchariphilus polymeriproducens TaxID=1812858 RepID=A0A371AYM2_9FIRM|nr:4Fe-4S binding protein [Anaerosacchariphilus polymeriproducens]RDU24698.1 epoxyqueuosine reductase [Anaerosacchariphilus polymeriproducens]